MVILFPCYHTSFQIWLVLGEGKVCIGLLDFIGLIFNLILRGNEEALKVVKKLMYDILFGFEGKLIDFVNFFKASHSICCG